MGTAAAEQRTLADFRYVIAFEKVFDRWIWDLIGAAKWNCKVAAIVGEGEREREERERGEEDEEVNSDREAKITT